ncbi:CASP-like protein 1C1 [Punica granatum]|uniref:CASP-like protein n=2 Tax=Punica granatum TaxID=22663 RepID=A0A218X1F7_PUNGR|nr:CASP-like protein 1C1 [Punica granatum]OWM78648.1 hypothetical protein CDL15_Pgr002819 [Punica granatum]PKI32077.1 hypothetical protein CRG98_047549 [Punica granatum]
MEKNPKRILALLLRVLALGAAVSATIVMATSHERANFFTASFEAEYSDTPAFKYFVIVNAVVSAYSLIALFVPWGSLLRRLLVTLDLLVTMLLTSSISAALAIAQVGKKGNSHAGWLPICGQVPKYCDHVTGALAAGFAAVIIYTILLMFSVHSVLNDLLN